MLILYVLTYLKNLIKNMRKIKRNDVFMLMDGGQSKVKK